MKKVLAHNDRNVRMDVLQRIAALHIEPLTNHVLDRMLIEPDSAVQGQAIITYASLSPSDTTGVLSPYLNDDSRDIRRGAMIGILCHDPGNDTANNYLLELVRSETARDRLLASEIMVEIASDHFSGFLVELITDPDINIVEHAIEAAGLILDDRLINQIVRKLAEPALLPTASIALRRFGEAALYDLDLGLISPETHRPEKFHIIDIIREIGGVKATEVLLRHIDIEQPEIRHRIFLSLAGLHYQADPDDQYIFVNKLDEEVQNITWLLAAMEDLYGDRKHHLVHSALGHELDVKRDSMLLLVSFLFPSIVMLNTRANIDSKVAELRIFALEVLDNLLTGEIKQVVLPLLDDLTVAERLELLAKKYPQEAMTAEERFRDVMDSHFGHAFFWTRNTLLYEIGKGQDTTFIGRVRESLSDKEATTRETALWALRQLNPPDIRRSLNAHTSDESPIVTNIVQWLLTDVPNDGEI